MASMGKTRSYMIHNILSLSVVLKAEVKSTIRGYISCFKSEASSRAIMIF